MLRHGLEASTCGPALFSLARSSAALAVLTNAWNKHKEGGGGSIAFRELLEKYLVNPSNKDQLTLSYDEVADHNIDSHAALKQKFDSIVATFLEARERAIKNTEYYLSMVNDLDVYVATSMRTRQNFRDMAGACDSIFQDPRLRHLHLRYFDPTMSAARGHEDKGLIECLMVKCRKCWSTARGRRRATGRMLKRPWLSVWASRLSSIAIMARKLISIATCIRSRG